MGAVMDAILWGKQMVKRIRLLTPANKMYGKKTCKDQ
jgi:hypothetical protein